MSDDSDDEGLPGPGKSVARVTTWALAAAVVVTFALGLGGFRAWSDESWRDDVYSTLQLFAFAEPEHPEDPGKDLNVGLDVARFLAAGVSLVAVGAIARQLFTDQLDRAVLRRRKGHVVIVGAGKTGRRLVRAYRQRGRAVVVIDRSDASVPRRPNDGLRLLSVQGDPTDPRVLARARVEWADVVIAVCRNDAENVPVVAAAARLGEHSPWSTRAYAHVPDETTHRLLVERARLRSNGPDHAGMTVTYFNLVKRGARSLLSDHPPFRSGGFVDEPDPQVAVVGDGSVARAIVIAMARLWPFVRPSDDALLRITLVTPDADDVIEQLQDEHPREAKRCAIGRRANLRGDPAWLDEVTNVFVCMGDDDRGLATAMAVHAQDPDTRVVLVAEAMSERAADGLLDELGDGLTRRSVHIFSLADRTLSPELIEDPNTELLAQGIHAGYVEELVQKGMTPSPRHPALCPWNDLTPRQQESNRRQARHIEVKLGLLGCVLLPLSSTEEQPIRGFEPDEVEALAQVEHERWMEDKRSDGYVFGAERNDTPGRCTHPDLVSWEELSEATRDLDRLAVTRIPALLARVGYGAYRRLPSD